MDSIDSYLSYISSVRRYSQRTKEIYGDVLREFRDFSELLEDEDSSNAMTRQLIRSYEVHLLDDRGLDARTVNLHLSVLSGYAKYLMRDGIIESNPVRLVNRPKMSKTLPEFYRDESMDEYFLKNSHAVSQDELDILKLYGQSKDKTAINLYSRRLRHLIVSLLHGTAIRRAELISLSCSSVDFSRHVLKVHGKGDKSREIPLFPELLDEIRLYNESVESFLGQSETPTRSLLLTSSGRSLYPAFVERAVREELSSISSITGKKSPHVLRHTLATSLLNDGADLNSIKEFLGHSSLAATQVYTHNSIEKLKSVYASAHPRAKKK